MTGCGCNPYHELLALIYFDLTCLNEAAPGRVCSSLATIATVVIQPSQAQLLLQLPDPGRYGRAHLCLLLLLHRRWSPAVWPALAAGKAGRGASRAAPGPGAVPRVIVGVVGRAAVRSRL